MLDVVAEKFQYKDFADKEIINYKFVVFQALVCLLFKDWLSVTKYTLPSYFVTVQNLAETAWHGATPVTRHLYELTHQTSMLCYQARDQDNEKQMIVILQSNR